MDEQNYILEAEKKVLDIKGLPESLPKREINSVGIIGACLLYTSPSPRDTG